MPNPYRCPNCRKALVQRSADPGSCWVCEACGGAAVTMIVIRRHATRELANRIWSQARDARTQTVRKCPSCEHLMKTFEIQDSSGKVELDGCVPCQFFWFDPGELERIRVATRELPPSVMRPPNPNLRNEGPGENPVGEAMGEVLVDSIMALLFGPCGVFGRWR